MIHHSCDRCKRVIDTEDELRYVVRIEIQASMAGPAADCEEDERDHLLEVHEILERCEDMESGAVGEDVYQHRKFDLCPACYRKFAKNPLGQEVVPQLDFSKN